jgi:hypothetical protein
LTSTNFGQNTARNPQLTFLGVDTNIVKALIERGYMHRSESPALTADSGDIHAVSELSVADCVMANHAIDTNDPIFALADKISTNFGQNMAFARPFFKTTSNK